ncbi:MAG: extracellular solute-binding protein [Lentisphaeria bacterium]|nr:extracellular solute-binding protein [Lentisphaeria bacterium]
MRSMHRRHDAMSPAGSRPGRALAGLAWALLSALSAAGGWVEDREDRTVIHVTLWFLPDPSRTDTFSRAESAGVREFIRRFPALFEERIRPRIAANPGKYGRHKWDKVEIDLRQFSGITVEGVETDLLAIAGKVAPDVMYVNFRKSDTYIQQSFLYPLDREEDGYLTAMTPEELDFRIHPKIWPVIRRRGRDGVQRVYAVPYGGALGKVLLYRKDLFDEQAIPYPDKDWTWDDLYAACRRITDPAKGIYGMQLGRGKHESWYWITFLWSAGGDILVYDDTSHAWQAVFDSRNAAVALDFYTRLCTEKWTDAEGKPRYGYAYKETQDSNIKWDRGELAMAFSYIDEKVFHTINPDVTGMCPVPLGPPLGPDGERIRGGELNSRMMGLFAGIRDPLVRDAAWEYIRFYESRDAVEIKTRIMVEGGLGRFINPKYLREFRYDELIRLAPRGWAETFDIAVASGMPEPYGKHSNLAYDILTEPIHKAEEMALDGDLPENDEERLDVLQDLLRTAATKARKEMLGVVPPREMLKRRLSAVAALLAIVVVFVVMFRWVIQAFTPPVIAGERRGWQFRRYAWGYVLLCPAVLSILVWSYVPLLRGSVMSFQEYRIMGDSTLVWLDNYANVIWDRDFWMAIWNSVRYATLVVSLTFLPPVILAVLLQEVPHGKILFRTLFYLPAVITGLVVILLWKSFYDPTERGALNAVVMHIPASGFLLIGLVLFAVAFAFAQRMVYHEMYGMGALFFLIGAVLFYTCFAVARPIFHQQGVPFSRALFQTLPEPYTWLNDADMAMLCCVLPMVWAGMGPGCLIYLAALKGIPDDYYEAADLDGATFIDKILFTVIPTLRPLIIINFVGVFIRSWYAATGNILAMTGGGKGTEVIGLHIFYKAFMYLNFGEATAMAWLLGLMLIGFTVYQLRILSRVEFRATGNKT